MRRTDQVKDYMKARQSISITTAMLDPRFEGMERVTFMRVCRAAGYSCADDRVSRRITKLERNCFKCECDRSGVRSAIGKQVKRLAHYVAGTLK